ncbi:MAG: hypothetical protein ACRDL7_10510, partial [Gaiellaceae bacterium]
MREARFRHVPMSHRPGAVGGLGALVAAIALLSLAGAPAGAAQAARRLSLADAVALAGGQAPPVTIAESRTRGAEARVTQSRAALLPELSGSASQVSRTFNKNSLGITFPAAPGVTPIPDLIGPYNIVDARLHVSQTLLDVSGWESWQASRGGAEA